LAANSDLVNASQATPNQAWAKIYNTSFFLEILSQIGDSLGNVFFWRFRTFLSIEWFLSSLNIISDITFNLLKIAAFLLLLAFMILLVRRVFKKEEGLVIMPFETSGNEQGKYNGKLVSDLLTGELQRILKVHNHVFEEISVTVENLSIPAIVPRSETLDYSIADMGTVGNGSTTLSIGSLIVAFKRLCPGSEPVPILTGSLGCFGSLTELAACLEGRKIQAWEVRHGPKAGEPALEECIPGLIRDLSFKIAFDLALADSSMGVSAKTWRGFMNFTEALEAYYNYTQTVKAKDLRRAKRSCIRAVYSEKEYDKAVEMLGALGFVYAEKKDYPEAKRLFKIVSKFKMDLGSFGIGFVSGLLNENKDELAAYNKAIEIDPQFFLAWQGKGIALCKLNRLDDALAAFDRAIESNPHFPEAWYNKGLALGKLKRPEDELVAYDKAIEINPQYSKAWNNKGVALGELDRPDDEMAAYNKAIEFDPHFPKPWYNKGVLLGKLNRPVDELAAYNEAIKLNPQYLEAWYNCGITLGKLNQLEDALSAFDKVIEINPQHFEAWYSKGVVLGKMNRLEDALAAFGKAIEIDPQYSKAWYSKGVVLGELNRPEDARAAFEKAIELNSQFPEAWFGKGLVLKALHRDAEAAEAFSRAKELGFTGAPET
jgi:tetratricopeptide (TPR) repeat protein